MKTNNSGRIRRFIGDLIGACSLFGMLWIGLVAANVFGG